MNKQAQHRDTRTTHDALSSTACWFDRMGGRDRGPAYDAGVAATLESKNREGSEATVQMNLVLYGYPRVADRRTLARPSCNQHCPDMDASQIAHVFHRNGSLRNIYILDSSLWDWRSVRQILTAEPDLFSFAVDGVPMPPPQEVEDVFQLRDAHAVLLSLVRGKQRFNCHFFRSDIIELDVDPRDVDGPTDATDVTEFLRLLGRCTGKSVLLTEENFPEYVIGRYDPDTDSFAVIPSASCPSA